MIDLVCVQKILVIKLRAVGDVLLSTIVLKNLRHHFPDAQIDFLTEPASREVLEANPSIDDIVIFDRKGEGNLSFFSRVRKTGYDLVIDLFGNPRTALMTFLSGARFRVGYPFRGRRYAYNILAESRRGELHNVEFNLDALRALGIEIVDRQIPFAVSNEDVEFISAFVRERGLEGENLVALNPSGTWYTKRWGLKKFAELGDALTRVYNVRVALLWGPGELQAAQQIRDLMTQPAFIPPATSLKQLGALLKRCMFVVSNDTAPMHLAAVLGVPTLGIFGPTNPHLQGPIGQQSSWVRLDGLECLGCNLTACPIGHICMERLSVDAVLNAVEKLLKKNQILTTREHA